MSLRAIPAELKERPQWVVWRYESVPGRDKLTKVPYAARQPSIKASSTNPHTWTTIDEAVSTYRQEDGVDGIGYVLAPDDPYTGVDLDHCRDPQSGDIEPWAWDVVRRLCSYTEVSPSETGLRIFLRAQLPEGRRRHGNIEMYERGRYLTVTGDHLEGTPKTIEERTAELAAWHAEVFPAQPTRIEPAVQRPRTSLSASDAELITMAKAAKNGAKFVRLWAGDLATYGSASEADLALCSLLAFWTGGDEGRIDSLFRQSGLFRPEKWDSRRGNTTYGALTVARAAQTCSDYFTPSSPPVVLKRPGQERHTETEAAEVSGAWPMTDLGNAARLVARYGHGLRYCHLWGKWLIWDGTHWQIDDTGAIMRCAKNTVRAIYQEAADADEAEAKALAKHAIRSQAEARLRAMVSLAESEPDIPVTPAQLDSNPWLLCVANGTIDLQTGLLRPHSRDDLITRHAPVTYDPGATSPVWDGFLSQVLGGQAGLIHFLQRAAGYSLTGDTRERVLFFLHGIGRNGKSTFIEALRTLLGDYASRTPTETLLAKQDGAIPNDVARLKGARYVSASETEEGKRLAEALVKALTGGDTVSARFMRGEWFDFRPEFKLWLATNHKPVIRGTDKGIWDRIRLIPFEVRIPDGEEDKDLPAKLAAEMPGILAWAVRGCLDWQRDGLGFPAEVRAATESYRAEMDILAAFLSEFCVEDPQASAPARALYGAYKTWAEETGERPVTQRRFGSSLGERGFRSKHVTAGSVWFGLRLLTNEERTRASQTMNDSDAMTDYDPNSRITESSSSQSAYPENRVIKGHTSEKGHPASLFEKDVA